jgi:PRA1 family protein 1
MLAWVALFFLRDDPFALCGRTVRDWAVLVALSAITLAVLLVAGPAVGVLKALLVGAGVVLLHAVLHQDAVRWYTLMSPSSA